MFDSLKDLAQDAVAGATGAGSAGTTDESHEQSVIAGLLGAGGGQLPDILKNLNVGGLGRMAQSWIGKGDNEPVSAEQVKVSLPQQVAAVAAKFGISSDEAAAKIAKYLPGIIDRLTPDGLVPDPEALAKRVGGFLKF